MRVCDAVEINGLKLQFASEELKNDKEIDYYLAIIIGMINTFI